MNEITLHELKEVLGVSKGRILHFRKGWLSYKIWHEPIFENGIHYFRNENDVRMYNKKECLKAYKEYKNEKISI